MVHVLSAEAGWLDRCGGPKRGPRLNPDDFPTIESVIQAWDRVEAQVKARQLTKALDGLAQRDRDVLLLTAWAGLDSTEVAQALDIPVGTVRSRLHRARHHLRAACPLVDVEETGNA